MADVAGVCVFGSVNQDLVATGGRLPAPGETVLARSFAAAPGGKGANQAVAAARAGARTRFAGAVGDDDFGADLRAGLVEESVDITGLATRPATSSGVALIAVADDAENMVIVVPGANATASLPADALEGCAVLLAQLETPIHEVVAAFDRARAVGVTTVLNAAPAASLGADVLALVDVLVVNEHELAALGDAAETVATLVVTLGANGAMARTISADGTAIASFAVAGHDIDAVDTVGAGDAFCGVLAADLAAGWSLQDAVVRANAAGALATTRPGARSSPTSAELDAFLATVDGAVGGDRG